MNEFENTIKDYIGEDNFNKIQKTKVGIAGAGGLGSNCASNLVRCGFKKLCIVDFDVVEFKNLNRQFYFFDQVGMPKIEALKKNLLRINPDLELNVVFNKIAPSNIKEIFEDCDIVVEAFDQVEYKTLMVEEFCSSGKLLISASGLAGWGRSDDIKVREVHSDFFIIGDLKTEVDIKNPPMSPRVGITAAKQADVILEYVLKEVVV